jgi:hypothetical protein
MAGAGRLTRAAWPLNAATVRASDGVDLAELHSWTEPRGGCEIPATDAVRDGRPCRSLTTVRGVASLASGGVALLHPQEQVSQHRRLSWTRPDRRQDPLADLGEHPHRVSRRQLRHAEHPPWEAIVSRVVMARTRDWMPPGEPGTRAEARRVVLAVHGLSPSIGSPRPSALPVHRLSPSMGSPSSSRRREDEGAAGTAVVPDRVPGDGTRCGGTVWTPRRPVT